MEFSFWSDDARTAIVHVGERLDFSNARPFGVTCQRYVDTGVRRFVFDFSETRVLDSTGLGVIFTLVRQLRKEDGLVVFAAPSRPVRMVVLLTRTADVLPQFGTVESALDFVGAVAAHHPAAS